MVLGRRAASSESVRVGPGADPSRVRRPFRAGARSERSASRRRAPSAAATAAAEAAEAEAEQLEAVRRAFLDHLAGL